MSTLICAYCKRSSSVLQICSHCEKVAYCCDNHKSRHATVHKRNCFPAFIASEEECGRYWIASRNISKGELIFQEIATIIGPNCENLPSISSNLYPTCLGCCRITNTSYNCSKCHWPMCSKKCEKISQHAEFECKIFRKNTIYSSTRPQYYLYIQLLRALLLKTVNLEAFNKIMELEPHIRGRASHPEESRITSSFYKFLTEECNLSYDYNFVDHVVGVVRINSYAADILYSRNTPFRRKRACSALFYQMSLLNHTCLPNTRSVIKENDDMTLSMALYATIDIFEGQPIHQQYFPVVKGRTERRKALREWYFDCCCSRCSDPTELGTFFSCPRCCRCSEGYLCPVNPLDDFSDWKCSEPTCQNFVCCEEIGQLINSVDQEVETHEHSSIEELEALLQKLLADVIHIKHYITLNMQYEILHKLVSGLDVDNVQSEDEPRLHRGVQYCRNILVVVNNVCPGYSYYRGVILYFMASCCMGLYKRNVLSNNECSLHELQQIITEGKVIMGVEPKGSIYWDMAEELATFHEKISLEL